MALAAQEFRWWAAKESPHELVFSLARRIERAQSGRIEDLREYKRMYEDRSPSLLAPRRRRVSYNVIRSCINTAAAKISKNRPRPLFLTTGGDFELQQRAKKLTRFIDGVFAETGAYAEGQRVFRDAAVYGTGALRLCVEDGRLRAERVMVDEILVDPIEGYYGKPRQLHQKRAVNRDVLTGLFPRHAQAIKGAPAARPADTRRDAQPPWGSTMVDVVESWHLPSTSGGTDGKHAICLDGATLFVESYERSGFPFVFLHWEEPLEGFWGHGLAEELRGLQLEINKLLEEIRIAQKRLGRPYVALPTGAKVNKADINNEVGTIIEFDGPQPPIFGVSPAMPAEVYRHLDTLYARAYEITGISQLSAQSKKPAGLDSGVALREFQDIETERFVLIGQRYEQMFLAVTRILIDLARDLYADGDDISVKTRAGKFLESVKFGDVDLEDDQYDLQVFPTSLLPATPAGRLQTVAEMAQAGLIDPLQAKRLLDFPDVEDAVSLDTAALDDVRMVVDHMLAGGEYIAPEPYMDLELARKVTLSAYLRARLQKVSEERLDLLRNFLADIDTLLSAATPPASPGPPPGVGPELSPGAGLPSPGAPPLLPPLPPLGPDAAALAALGGAGAP